MKISAYSLLAVIVIPILASCASHPVALAPVGPEPALSQTSAPQGYLQVFSAIEPHQLGDSTFYYPHTGYYIVLDSGRKLKYVNNHLGIMDESPSLVDVPVGHYRIIAESANHGNVTVPVVIEAGRTTAVHLEGDWKPAADMSKNTVRFPSGEAIGWNTGPNP